MPIVNVYPSAINRTDGTWASTANILDTVATTYTTNTSSLPINSGLGINFQMNWSVLPGNATVNQIRAVFVGRCNTASSRSFYSFDIWTSGKGALYVVGDVMIPTADSYLVIAADEATIANRGYGNTNDLKLATEITVMLLSKATASRITYWGMFYLEVTYTPLSSGYNPLFMGENF